MLILVFLLISLIGSTPSKKRVKIKEEDKISPSYIDKFPPEIHGLIAEYLSQIDVIILRSSCRSLRHNCEQNLENLKLADMEYVKDLEALEKLRSPLKFNEAEVAKVLKCNIKQKNYKNMRYFLMNFGSMDCVQRFYKNQLHEGGKHVDGLMEGNLDFILKCDNSLIGTLFVYSCTTGRFDIFELLFKPFSKVSDFRICTIWKACARAAVKNKHSNIYNYLIETPISNKNVRVLEYLYVAAAQFGVDDLVRKLYKSARKDAFNEAMLHLCGANKVDLVRLLRHKLKNESVNGIITALLKTTDPSTEIVEILLKDSPLLYGALEAAAGNGRVNYITWALRNRQAPDEVIQRAIKQALINFQSASLFALVNFGNRKASFKFAFDFLIRSIDKYQPLRYVPLLKTFVTEIKGPFADDTVSQHLEDAAFWTEIEVDVLFNALSPDTRKRLAYQTGQDSKNGFFDFAKLKAFYHDERSLEAYLAGSLKSQSSQSLHRIFTFKNLNDPQGPSLIPRVVKLIDSCSLMSDIVFQYLCDMKNAELTATLVDYLTKSAIQII